MTASFVIDSKLLFTSQSQSQVTLRLAAYRKSVCLGVKHLETHDQRFFSPSEPLQ
jgi:hypothetical protein